MAVRKRDTLFAKLRHVWRSLDIHDPAPQAIGNEDHEIIRPPGTAGDWKVIDRPTKCDQENNVQSDPESKSFQGLQSCHQG